MVEVAGAMEYAHRHGVIHRDLKPANILLGATAARGSPTSGWPSRCRRRRADGIGPDDGHAELHAAGASGRQAGEMGPAADVYALGATLYAMVTGRPPFQAATAMDTVIQVLEHEPVAPRRLNASIPRDLETICLKCLEKDPAHATGLRRRWGRIYAVTLRVSRSWPDR